MQTTFDEKFSEKLPLFSFNHNMQLLHKRCTMREYTCCLLEAMQHLDGLEPLCKSIKAYENFAVSIFQHFRAAFPLPEMPNLPTLKHSSVPRHQLKDHFFLEALQGNENASELWKPYFCMAQATALKCKRDWGLTLKLLEGMVMGTVDLPNLSPKLPEEFLRLGHILEHHVATTHLPFTFNAIETCAYEVHGKDGVFIRVSLSTAICTFLYSVPYHALITSTNTSESSELRGPEISTLDFGSFYASKVSYVWEPLWISLKQKKLKVSTELALRIEKVQGLLAIATAAGIE